MVEQMVEPLPRGVVQVRRGPCPAPTLKIQTDSHTHHIKSFYPATCRFTKRPFGGQPREEGLLVRWDIDSNLRWDTASNFQKCTLDGTLTDSKFQQCTLRTDSSFQKCTLRTYLLASSFQTSNAKPWTLNAKPSSSSLLLSSIELSDTKVL